MRKIGSYSGSDVTEITLESSHAALSIMNYGAVIRDWRVDAGGLALPMVLGFKSFDDYPAYSRAFGAIAGRVANRTARGQFNLNGTSYQLPINNGPNHLHGGPEGLGKLLWDMEPDGTDAVQLTHRSPDGHMGYPGSVVFEVTYRLDGPQLTIDMMAQADRPTPINLAQHNYYTLGAANGVRDCMLYLDADRYTPVDDVQIPTGRIESVADTRFDFRTSRSFRQADPEEHGIDHNLVLTADRDPAAPVAVASNLDTGLGLKLWTDQPGLQLFNAWHFDLPVPGHDGIKMGNYPGFCLEPQHYPDSLNQPDWPSIIYGPERPYRQQLKITIE